MSVTFLKHCIWYSSVTFFYSVTPCISICCSIYFYILWTLCVFDFLQYIPLFRGHPVYLIFCNIFLYSVDTLCIWYSAIYSFNLWTPCVFDILKYMFLYLADIIHFWTRLKDITFKNYIYVCMYIVHLLGTLQRNCIWFNALTKYFVVALNMRFQNYKALAWKFSFLEVICKIVRDFCVSTCNSPITLK